jgi:FkbM family methyltransferase
MSNYWQQVESIQFIDLGCSGSLDKKWYDLLSLLEYIGFDPNEQECQRLNQQSHPYKSATYFPYAIAGEEGIQTMYKTNSIYCYSLLRPNHNWLKRFSYYDLFKETGTEQVKCTTLNNLAEKENLKADIIKLDTQGLELPILQAGTKVLNHAFCVETETGFVENYQGETTYSQIDQFMRSHGYMLFDFKFHKVGRNNHFQSIGKHQPLWCETVWLFDFIGQNKQPTLTLAFNALRICKALQYCDYGLELAKYFKDCGILNHEMLEFFKKSENWQVSPKITVSKAGKLLRFLPKKINKKLLFGLQEILE